MKTAVRIVAVVLLGSLLVQAQQGPRKKRVAVMDFDYGTVHSDVAALFGTDVDVGKGMADLLVKHLVQDGTYSVVERRALDKILAEQNFSTSDRANPASAAQLGKLLGVDAIILGTITQFGGETHNTNVGGAGGGWGGWGLGHVGHKSTKAIVTVDCRIVDIDTAEILAVADGHGESSRSSTNLLGGGGSWHGFGAGGVDFGSSDFENTIIGEAVKAAMQQLSAGVIADADRLHIRTIQVSGQVAYAQGDTVVLNVGAKAGLKAGDQLSIERVTQEIKDPATGKILRRLSTKIGEVQVTDVDADSAQCKILSGAGFRIGDLAKTTTQ
ncbi:MAG TPA: CsgG/HfaB family protein [Terriglobales bacterium]|nr:CsgG/HfaB family protein [Terriglobales bacterium]